MVSSVVEAARGGDLIRPAVARKVSTHGRAMESAAAASGVRVERLSCLLAPVKGSEMLLRTIYIWRGPAGRRP